jgi:hypothetical protein
MTTPTDQASTAALESELARSQMIRAHAAADSPNPDEGGAPAAVPRQDTPAPAPEPAPLERVTTGDKMRAAIAARFKAGRGEGIDFHGDYRDPSQSYGPYGTPAVEARDSAPVDGPEPGIPARLDEAPADRIVPPAPAAAGPAPQPVRPPAPPHGLEKVVVHGVEMWLTPEQVLAEAGKSLAAGNILETAKEIKDAVSRSTASRPARLSGPAGDDPQRRPAPPDGADPDQDDVYGQLVHDLQYGDPSAARDRLRKTIAADARAATQEALVRERFGGERSHRIRSLAAFQAANPDLAADPYAHVVITSEVNRQYVADLEAIGVPVDQMPKTPAEVADWHMQARVQGKPVRDIAEIFETAKTRFTQWRGGPRPSPAQSSGHIVPPGDRPQPASRLTAPRVELSPDRTQRRANVPVQPTRASAPIAQPVPQAAAGGDRSAAVMAMRRARGQVTG